MALVTSEQMRAINALRPKGRRIALEIVKLQTSGELKDIYKHMVERIGLFELECCAEGRFWAHDTEVSLNHLFLVLRADCSESGTRVSPDTLRHLVTYCARRMREECLRIRGNADRVQIVVTPEQLAQAEQGFLPEKEPS